MENPMFRCTHVLMLFVFLTTGVAAEQKKKPLFPVQKTNLQYISPLPQQKMKEALIQNSSAFVSSQSTIWQEDFEQGSQGWTVASAFDTETYWHLSQTGALGGAGTSYWCADPTINGYDNEWHQLLVSPEIDLTTASTPQLIFMHDYALESPEGASQQIPGIDGWDGIHVSISTDGSTFIPINPSVPYPRQSLFGFTRPYGFDIPGWAGKSDGWQQATFDLTGYAGQKVFIRFEFGSDPGFATDDDPTLFGWRVDDIRIVDGNTTLFADDGGDTGPQQMTAAVLPQKIYWHEVNTRSNSPTTSWWCGDDATGKYPNYIFNYLISPKIYIPAIGENGNPWFSVTLDFMHLYSMEFNDPKFDFFIIEISNDGETWENPTESVYVGSSSNRWITFVDSYETSTINLASMAGDSIQIRWGFSADWSENDIGFFLDDPIIVGVSGLPNDIEITDFDVAFPNIVGLPNRTIVEVFNPGLNDQETIPLWYRLEGSPQTPVPPVFPLQSSEMTTREFSWTVGQPGDYHLTAFTALPVDDNRSNDSLGTINIIDGIAQPIPVGNLSEAELGYDDRFDISFLSLTDRIVYFTPNADISSTANLSQTSEQTLQGQQTYDLNAVAVFLIDNQQRQDVVQITIGTAASPTTLAQIIYDAPETVPFGDSRFHAIDLSSNPAARDLTEDFLVRISYANSNGSARVLLDGGTRFTGHNYFSPDTGKTFLPVDIGTKIRALVSFATTDVEEDPVSGIPGAFKLYPNYPNPIQASNARNGGLTSKPETLITFDLPHATNVKITIYDILGRQVQTLLDKRKAAGRHALRWNVQGQPAGIYFYKLQAPKFEAVGKLLIL